MLRYKNLTKSLSVQVFLTIKIRQTFGSVFKNIIFFLTYNKTTKELSANTTQSTIRELYEFMLIVS